MLKRFLPAVLAAAIFAASGSIAMLSAALPAGADQDDHHLTQHHARASHVAYRAANPYGANGYWSNGTWHRRLAANNGRHHHYGWTQTHRHAAPAARRDHDHR